MIGIGTRWSDFTTASKSAFQDPDVRFVNVNVAAFDAAKHSGLAVVADAREALAALREPLAGYRAGAAWERRAGEEAAEFAAEVERLVAPRDDALPHQAAVIGAVNDAAGETGVVVCAAGSMPGDLHKLWRARDPPQGLPRRVRLLVHGLRDPGRDGRQARRARARGVRDGRRRLLPDGAGRPGHRGRRGHQDRGRAGGQPRLRLDRRALPQSWAAPSSAPTTRRGVDLATNAESLGLRVLRTRTVDELRGALETARGAEGPVAIHIETDRYEGVPAYEGWWDVPVAEVGGDEEVRKARDEYEANRKTQRIFV